MESLVGLLSMFINGEIKEARLQEIWRMFTRQT